MKTISFVVPCYNSAPYMDSCIESILSCGSDIEVILVNDGSSDDTLLHARAWESAFPGIVVVLDQENRGHGGAVNRGLASASGIYFKVVDSDDWLDEDAMRPVMDYLRTQAALGDPTDLVVANYLYDKANEGKRQVMAYRNVFPEGRRFSWREIGSFSPSQYLLMHSVIYRTGLLRACGLALPEHCFYVDNIFVYVPLPHVKSLYYLDVDMYHYFIGREGQSVNESVMLSRIDQQLRITRFMIDEVDLAALEEPKLARYMYGYLSMMMCICSVFLRMDPSAEAEAKRTGIWAYLKEVRPSMYAKVRANVLNLSTNLPSPLGRAIGLGGYRIAQRIFKFN